MRFAVNNKFFSGQTIAKIAFRPKGGITAEEVKEINLRVSFFLWHNYLKTLVAEFWFRSSLSGQPSHDGHRWRHHGCAQRMWLQGWRHDEGEGCRLAIETRERKDRKGFECRVSQRLRVGLWRQRFKLMFCFQNLSRFWIHLPCKSRRRSEQNIRTSRFVPRFKWIGNTGNFL